jgi:hypothetical protein
MAMRRRITALLLSFLMGAGLAVTAAAPAHAATSATATVFAETNAQRTKAGLRPLMSDAALDRAAQAWAQHMASSCTFAHSTSAWRSARTTSSGWSATGENIAAGYTATNVVKAWMASSGHRANILNARYTGVGIGHAKGTCYSTYWVQVFGLSKSAMPAGAGDLTGDLAGDVVATDSLGQLLILRGNGAAGWKGTAVAGSGWQPGEKLVTLGDFTGDGMADVARIRLNGDFELLRGNAAEGFSAPVKIGNGWGSFRAIIGGMDFNGDRRTDVLAVTPAGALMLYRGNGAGGWSGSGTQIGNGWQTLNSIMYAGDFDGDSHGDLIGRRTDGTLWLYRSAGTGAWIGSRQIGNGWNGMTALLAPGDFDGNGSSDVLARRSDGFLVLYRGNGRGGWGTVSVVGNGWNGMTQIW